MAENCADDSRLARRVVRSVGRPTAGQLIHTLLNAVHIFSPIVHEWALLDMITSLLKGGGGNLGFRAAKYMSPRSLATSLIKSIYIAS